MPLTDDELRNNYYLAVIVYLCDYGGVPYTKTDPSTGDDWDFMLVDDGQPPHPNPTIGTWGVEAKPAPTDAQMREDTDMSMIDAAFEALFGSEAVKEKKARQVIERRKLALREAKLARETAARLEAERQEAERAEAERAEAERAEKERAEAEFLERELAEVAEAAEASGREAASVEAIFGETGEAAETAEASGPGAASAGAALSGEAGGPE
ncbi:MAG TPA: hypothetical protein VNI01_10950, partial [Elusimicrobiota bacterium]|nr:hypothetical protein [Elusimicrobiota bacterium]